MMRTLVLCCACLLPSSAWAWSAIGHRMSAETAALLLRDRSPGLGDLLARHRFELGMYAFLPDMRFRYDGEGESPLHYFSLDAARAVPREEWRQRDFGKAPWRASQLFGLARDEWKKVKQVSGAYERGAIATGEKLAVFNALYYMGVLAHYAADAAVPHHASADANSVKKGQNGLHFYFEGDCVEVLEPDLSARVLNRARKEGAKRLASLGDPNDVEALMFGMLGESLSTLDKLEQIDAEKVVTKKAEPPAFASRKPRDVGCKALAPIVEDRLVAASVLVAHLWQLAVPADIDWSKSGALQFNDSHAFSFIPFQ